MRTQINFRVQPRTRDRLDAIVEATRRAGQSYPDNRTDAIVLAIDRLWEETCGPDTIADTKRGRRGPL